MVICTLHRHIDELAKRSRRNRVLSGQRVDEVKADMCVCVYVCIYIYMYVYVYVYVYVCVCVCVEFVADGIILFVINY